MSEVYAGEIRIFAGYFIPQGWLPCDGRELSASVYWNLFQAIGARYGGNGSTTFCLPDLRGRMAFGQGTTADDTYTVGMKGGSETVALNQAEQNGAHTHGVNAYNGTGDRTSPSGALWANAMTARYESGDQGTPPDLAMNSGCVTPAGSGQAHENMPPFVVMTYIIAYEGNIPPRQ